MGAEMIISLVVGIVMSMASAAASKSAAESEQRYNSEEAQINRDWQHDERLESQDYNTDMWNESNKFNSIGEQIQRGIKAGVSPSAIVGGSYRSSNTSPVTTSPTGGAQASSDALSRLMSASLGTLPNMFNSTGSMVKNLTDSYNARELLSYNKKLLDSQVHLNYASLQELTSRAGVNDATEQQIRMSMNWLDELNYLDVMQKRAEIISLYNENYVRLQQLDLYRAQVESDIDVNDSVIDVNMANAGLTNANAEAVRTRNLYGRDVMQLFENEEDAKAYEKMIQASVAGIINLPLGSDKFQFNWSLFKAGLLTDAIDSVYIPVNQSEWTPQMYMPVDYTDGSANTVYITPRGFYNPQYSGWKAAGTRVLGVTNSVIGALLKK